MSRLPSLAALLLALAGCAPLDATGRRCTDATQCPIGMACVAEAPGEAGVCGFSTGTLDGAPGEGPGSVPGTGTDGQTPGTPPPPVIAPPPGSSAPTYCMEVKPILDRSCGGCHGSSPSGGAPSTFRLDSYADAGGVQGAAAKALRIKARAAVQQTMPPAGAPAPTQEERGLLAAWVDAGAPECGDVVVPPGGGTTPPPAPQVPEVVRFGEHVQPILSTFCVSCHSGGDPVGKLSLEPGRAYSQLLAESDCDSHTRRVVPGNLEDSLLWSVLQGHRTVCEDKAPPMPLDTPGLKSVSETDFLIIEKWIAQGARND
ncbi:MAG: hypothetical protein L0Y66_14105 [Myxococcaceae bacterium]|nr:hypothetical protein [Myxococcaceae bacterium]MCI0674012.1 hypothetical protein [Myxococcaceae bacterium]